MKLKGNAVEIKTDNLAGFSVLRDEVVFDTSAPMTINIDGQEAYKGPAPATGGIGFVKNQKGVWQAK